MRNSRRSLILTVVALLALCATALAAHPPAGKQYSGFTSAAKINGFRAPIRFKVSSNAADLLAFEYGSLGCIAFPVTGNPYAKPTGFIKLGTIAVSRTGSFSLANSKSVSSGVVKDTTVSTVTGTFKTATSATGKIVFTQSEAGPGGFHKSCGPVHLTFTATTK